MVPVAAVVFAVYVVIVIGLMLASGVGYEDFFDTADSTLRSAVLPLAVGAVWLVAFLVWARWDFVFRDARRLPMGVLLWALPVVMVVTLVLQLLGVDWSAFEPAHVLAVLAAAVLVGFTEETLFHEVILRALRQGDRSEAAAVGWLSLWFGGFHLTNLLLSEPGAVIQVVFAGLSGVAFYLVRRGTTVLVAAMVLHGSWDFSTFLAGVHPGDGGFTSAANFLVAVVYPLAAVTLVVLLVRERRRPARDAVTPAV
ncbi:CPBP family intramembrane glutamic endopeptidase [Cellulomonas sp. P5_C5]